MIRTVTAAVMRRDGGILLTRRGAGEKLAGFWEFPGGKVEDGETIEECLTRELLEELGIVTAVGGFVGESLYDYEHGHIRLVAYEVEHIDGDFELTVHDAMSWVAPGQLLDYKLAPADVEIARRLADGKRREESS